MALKLKSRAWVAWVFVAGLASGLLVLLVSRSLLGAALAATLSGMSATALASASGAASGKAGAAAAGIHAPAFAGAAMGALLQLLQLKNRPWPERVIVTLVSFVAAYFGGQLAAEIWPHLAAGGVGVAGTICAYIVVPLLDGLRVLLADVFAALRSLLRDVGWIKRLISSRAGAPDAAPPVAEPPPETAGDPESPVALVCDKKHCSAAGACSGGN